MLPRRPLALLCALAAAAPIAATVAHGSNGPPKFAVENVTATAAGRYIAASSDAPVLLRLRARERRRAVLSARARGHAHGRRGSPTRRPRATSDVQRTRRPVPGLAAWLADPETRKIKRCESGGDYSLIDVNAGVPYRGAWQMDPDFLRTFAGISPSSYDHGGRFTLSESAQDAAAYAGYLARGYEPWSCR